MVKQEFPADRQVMATVVAGVLQFVWIAFWWQYLKVPDSVICSRNPDPGGFDLLLQACPESHPFAGWVVALIPVVGPVLSMVTAVVFFGFPLNDEQTWRRFLLGIPFYSFVALFCLIVSIIVIALAYILIT